MPFWPNLIGYQLVWFAAVLGAARGTSVPGLVAALLFAAAHLVSTPRRGDDARLALAAAGLGVVVDGTLAALGWVQYGAAASAWPPVWLLAIWASFGLTLNHSFALAQRHLALSGLLAAIGGPLAYLAAGRLGAFTLVEPVWRGVAALALAWAVALPLLAALARQRRGRARSRRARAWT